ncbi:hypothetical protein FRC10_009032 [Ceratobasidium sp. 414]|nr:hypothetical protein FRC10_009032 [Ceratobasidium sp. 414]
MEDHPDLDAAGDLRKPIDKDLPDPTRCSLGQWCGTWNRLKDAGSRQQRDRFALTGHYMDPTTGRATRSRMDFHDHRIPDHIAPTQISDIDSVIGIVKDYFPIAPGVVLKYFMLLSPKHTLDADLHLPPIAVQDEHGPDKFVDAHRIPNGRFLEMEPQALIRIFFPRLDHAAGASNCLNEGNLRLLYDGAVYPAAIDKLPRELTGNWPGVWDDEMFRAGGNGEAGARGRQVQHTGRDVHSAYLNDFVARMRELVEAKEELEWARSFFFVVEMRGLKTKDGSMHTPPDPEAAAVDADGELDAESPRVRAVDQMLSSFNTGEFQDDDWFIDLGLNFQVPSPLGGFVCPLPVVEAHAAILAHVLGADMETCVRWVQGHGDYYQRDELAQLKALAGFRFTNPNPELTGVCYVQLYTSDKSLIYNLNLAKHAKRVTAWQVLDDWNKVRMNHFQPLLDAFRNASGAHEMYVRLEVRMEFSQYPFLQLRVPDPQARRWFAWADPKHWWGWKLYRLESAYSVLRMWIECRSKVTVDDLPEAASLLVSLVWMTNALVNRPDDGGTWNEVRDASSVHDMSEGALVPVWPLQAHFLHTLRFAPNQPPRLSSHRTVAIKTMLYICSSKSPPITEAQLHALITEPMEVESNLQPDTLDEGPAEEQIAYPRAVANKQRTVNARVKERRPDLFADVLPEPERVRRYESEDEDYEERPRPTPRSQELTDIVSNMPLQMFQKCPMMGAAHCPDGKPKSWCALQLNDPLLTSDIFRWLDRLPQAFPSHVLFGSEHSRWEATVNSIFPTIQESKKKTQGLHCLAARNQFVELQRRLAVDERAELVLQARRFVDEHWAWLPYGAPKGHLWATGKQNVPKSATHEGKITGGPWIILNPTMA